MSLSHRRGTFPGEGREGAQIPVLISYGPPTPRFPATQTGLGSPRGLALVAAFFTPRVALLPLRAGVLPPTLSGLQPLPQELLLQGVL